MDSAGPLSPGSGLLQFVACPDLRQQVVDDAAFVLVGPVLPAWRTDVDCRNVWFLLNISFVVDISVSYFVD